MLKIILQTPGGFGIIYSEKNKSLENNAEYFMSHICIKLHVLGNRNALKNSGKNKGKQKITGIIILEITKWNPR